MIILAIGFKKTKSPELSSKLLESKTNLSRLHQQREIIPTRLLLVAYQRCRKQHVKCRQLR